jgi:hypothetical protein
MKAKICGKWEIVFAQPVESEKDLDLNERSYLHFIAAKPELVAAKCWATEWLLTDLVEEGCSLVEYLAGAGVQAVIARNVLVPREHLVLERDKKCCEHLMSLGIQTVELDANKSMFEFEDYEVKFADFPSSSVISVQKKWKGFLNLFESGPKLVVWTDTACSYPISIHGGKYAKEFGMELLESWEDYVESYSKWLFKKTGFSIKKAAFRGRNAVYFAAVPGECDTEIKWFALQDCETGFIIGED